MIGKTLAHYKIVEMIGAGGMGEVYRANDTKLGRDVALKMLPPAFVQDAERMARFRREAQILASLNHPNIAAIYGLEEVDEAPFLVLELVPGATLFDRLRHGPIPIHESIDVAVQIAEAVEYAHESGVIHRDLKPANVKLTDDGRVKVLDFGLAKAMDDPRAESAGSGTSDSLAMATQSPTLQSPTLQSPITGALTGADVILGTAAYMSPEQARGHTVDRRADTWSFGVTLYEMLTGHRLFQGDTVSDLIAAVLKTEPDWSRLPADTPVRLRELLQRCLDKDQRGRLRDLGDVRLELEWIRDGKGADRAPKETGPRQSLPRIPFLIGAALIGAVVGVLLWNMKPGPTPDGGTAPVARMTAVLPNDVNHVDYQISPDGHSLLLLGIPNDPAPGEEGFGLYVRPIDEYEVRFIPGSRSTSAACYSPDSRWIAFVAPEEAGSTANYLWKVPVDGSAPRLKLLDWSSEWGGIHWLPDGDLITGVRAGAVVRIPTDGSAAREPIPLAAEGFGIEWTVTPRPGNTSRLPDGHHLLSSVEAWDADGYGMNIVALNVDSGQVTLLIENGANPTWSDTGHLLFSRGTTLLAAPFDPEALAVTGGPTALTDDLRIDSAWQHGEFQVSRNGTLAYVPGGFVGGDRRLVWLDRNFREIEPWSKDRFAIERTLHVSPDGERIATVIADPNGVYDIWISDPGQNVLRKWLEEPGRDCVPAVWSHDGTRMVYFSRTERGTRIYIRPVSGGTSVLLHENSNPGTSYAATSLADEGETLLLTKFTGDEITVVMLPTEAADGSSRQPEMLMEGARAAEMSPDGRWLAYRADRSGRWEIYVRRWLGKGALGPERRVSTNGSTGRRPYWYTPSDGGQLEIWYIMSDGTMYSVTLRGDPEPEVSRPAPVAKWQQEYDMMDTLPDGRVLMALLGENEGPLKEINVVVGWKRELERRLASASQGPAH